METHLIIARLETRKRIDAETGCWMWGGAKMVSGYGRVIIDKKPLYVHRVALEAYKGIDLTGKQVDHACRRPACFNPDHLRPVTDGMNKQNMPQGRRNNTSGFRGVTWNKRARKWQASYTLNRKDFYLGVFSDVTEAARVVSEARRIAMPYSEMDKAS